jgi:hypothetical protein
MAMVWRWIAIAAGGALVCTLGDHLHATHGVLGYTDVFTWSQAWWVPLLFFCSTLMALVGARTTRRMFEAPPLDPNPPSLVALDAIAFGVAYALTSFTHASPNLTIAILAIFWLIRIVAIKTPKWVIAFSLASAVTGPLVEATISRCGLFAYTHPDFVGVARWLPGIYLFVAPVAARFEALLSTADSENA